MEKNLEKLTNDHLHEAVHSKQLEKLFGDASNRQYFRWTLSDQRSFIVMQLPEGKSSVSEEITNFKGKPEELPFLNVQHFLHNCELPVPQVFFYDAAARIMLLEDLGEVQFFNCVAGKSLEEQNVWYHKALELLHSFQNKTAAHKDADCICWQRSFDSTLLNWEFDHFLEYGLEARGAKLSNAEKSEFIQMTRQITKEILKFPQTLVHRDFQSRNLMVKNKNLVLIDFQDALKGPYVYDLVALTRDSYVILSPEQVANYCAKFAQLSGADARKVQHDHALMTIQRKLKDAGRFVFIDHVKKNPNFLQYFPSSIAYVQHALQLVPQYAGLAKILEKYVPEWKA